MDTIGTDLHTRESQLCSGHDDGTVTERRIADARTLMEAWRLGAYRVAHRLSDARRHVRAELAARDTSIVREKCLPIWSKFPCQRQRSS